MSYLSGLGTTIYDLPNQGRNLRLYVKMSDGSFGTGHYNACQPGGPCDPATVDPQSFPDWNSMSAYAGARGEMMVLVDPGDIEALCGCSPGATGCHAIPNYPASFQCGQVTPTAPPPPPPAKTTSPPPPPPVSAPPVAQPSSGIPPQPTSEAMHWPQIMSYGPVSSFGPLPYSSSGIMPGDTATPAKDNTLLYALLGLGALFLLKK